MDSRLSPGSQVNRSNERPGAWLLPRSRASAAGLPALQRLQECHQIAQFLCPQLARKLVLEFGKDLFQRSGAVVVKVWPALADAAERGGIELAVAKPVRQADVEAPLGSVGRRLVTGRTLLLSKDF